MNDVHGVIHIHSCPVALAANLEWTVSHVLGAPIRLSWTDQSVDPGTVRTTIEWTGPSGTAARIASALRGWDQTRFEVWESAATNRDGVRYVHTPSLGIFFTLTDAAGNAVIGEDRIRYAMDVANGNADELEHELALALGVEWDDELEEFRRNGNAFVTVFRPATAIV